MINKASQLLETVKQINSDSEQGKYTMEYSFSMDLSQEAAHHAYSDGEDMLDIVLDDTVGSDSALKKQLDKDLWKEFKYIPGISGMELELEYTGKAKSADIKNLDDLKKALKDSPFKLTITLHTELDTQNRVAADNAVEKILGALK
jgi:hypothetical protein